MCAREHIRTLRADTEKAATPPRAPTITPLRPWPAQALTLPCFQRPCLALSFPDQEMLGRSSSNRAGAPTASPPEPLLGHDRALPGALPGSGSLGAGVQMAAGAWLSHRSQPSRTGRGSHSSGTCSAENTGGNRSAAGPDPPLRSRRIPLPASHALGAASHLSPLLPPQNAPHSLTLKTTEQNENSILHTPINSSSLTAAPFNTQQPT